jgi:hypothetical protein
VAVAVSEHVVVVIAMDQVIRAAMLCRGLMEAGLSEKEAGLEAMCSRA